MRAAVSNTLSHGIETHTRAISLTRAMSLGLRSDIPDDITGFFRNSGTAHIFSISGLHVGIIAGIMMKLLGLLMLGPRAKALVFAPLIIAYTAMAGAPPSAVRACLMILFYFGAPLFRRKPDSVSALCAAAFVILALAPMQITVIAFIFSFTCTAGILMMTTRFGILFKGLNSVFFSTPDVFNISHKRRKHAWFYLVYDAAKNAFAVSLAAAIVSVPVTAVVFGNIVPVAPIANLAVVPLSFCMVATSAASLLTGFFSHGLAELFNHANTVFCDTAILAADRCSRLPGGNFATKPWNTGHVVLYYVAMCALLHFLPRQKNEVDGVDAVDKVDN